MATFSSIARRTSCGLLLLLMMMMLMFTGTSVGQQSVKITNPPKNQTVKVGDPVTLTCGIDISYSGPFLWRTYVGNTVKQIYYCASQQECYPSNEFSSTKYQCTASHPQNSSDTYNLNITAVDLMDGARYVCNFPIGDVNGAASVVVIEPPRAVITEPLLMSNASAYALSSSSSTAATTTTSGSSSLSSTLSSSSSLSSTSSPASSRLSSSLSSGASTPTTTTTTQPPLQTSLGYLECSVSFGAPTFTDPQIIADRLPQLRMNFDGVDYFANASAGSSSTSNVKVTYKQGIARSAEYSLTLTVSRALAKADLGKELTCTVSTKNPAFSLSDSKQFVTSASENWVVVITTPPGNGTFYIDDVFNCSVPQEPNASIRWESVRNPHLMPVYNQSLTISENMVGEQSWKCVAYDSHNTPKEKLFNFNVTNARRYSATTNDDDDSAYRRRVGLGVGLGLGLPLIIAIIIIIIIIVLRRKRSPTKAAVKNGKQGPPAATTTTGYAPLAAEPEPQAPPIYQPRTNAQPLGRNASPVPSDEPSLNRSGHGDLGDIGFRPASLPSRSNSNLNASTERPLISLGGAPPAAQQPDGSRGPGGFADIGAGLPGRAPISYADNSHDSASAVSVPHSTSIRSSASSLNPSRQGPTYRQPAPRTGQATGV